MPPDQTAAPRFVPEAVTLALYRTMLTVFYVEERMKIFVRQGKCSFHASTRGHEELQVAMAMLLAPGRDWFFSYYRSKALAIGLGMPLKDVFLGMLSRAGDPMSKASSRTCPAGTWCFPAVPTMRKD